MNFKRLFIGNMLIILLVCMCLSTVCAADNTSDNVIIADSVGDNVIIGDAINGNSFADLQKEIGNTKENGTLNLDKDYAWSPADSKDPIAIDKSITINGNGHIIDAQKKTGIFKTSGLTNIVLNNIIFINANSSEYGGVIQFGSWDDENGGNCSVNNCIFINCSAGEEGGAVYIDEGNCIIVNCSFINCSAGEEGCAFYISSGDCHAVNCSFINCSADGDGGAIYMYNSLFIDNCKFDNCSSGNSGGDIYCSAFWDSANITVINSNFTNSHSAYGGGSIYIDYDADENDYCHIDNCNFNNCSSDDNGGAIYWLFKSNNNYLNNSNFTNCFAKGRYIYGGAIYCKDGIGELDINSCNFINNTAFGEDDNAYGGAIYFEGCDKNAYISNSTFINNSASKGGAIYAWDEEGVTIKYCEFYNNHANKTGGAIYLGCSYMTNLVYGSVFINNSATESSGAIAINGGNITNNIIIDNPSGDGADVSHVNYGDVYLAYNWWGSNENPANRINDIDNVNWVLMTFISNETVMYVGMTYNLTSGLTHITDGENVTGFNQYLPVRNNTFIAKTGNFSVVVAPLVNNTINTIYSFSTTNNTLYSKIDNQILELPLYMSSDLVIVKNSSSDIIANGSEFYYYINVTNKGFFNDTNVVIRDVLPDGLIFVSASNNGVYSNGAVVWNLTSLNVNESVVLSILVRAVQTGNITNNVTVSGDLYDINLTNNKDNHAVSIVNANMTVIKIADDSVIYLGNQTSFTVVVRNTGDCSLENVYVIENIPEGLVYTGFTGDKWIKKGNKFVYTGSLAAGKSANFTIFFNTTKTGNLTNVVVAGADNADNKTANNTTAVYSPSLDVIKLANTPVIYLGNQTSFTVVVRNTGDCSLENVYVIENIPEGLVYAGFTGDKWVKNGNKFVYTGSLAAGKSANFTIFFNTTKSGNFTNVVVAGADHVSNKTANNTTEVIENSPVPGNDTDNSTDVPDNSTAENQNTDINKSADVKNSTGNPILVLLMVLTILGLRPLKGKK